MTLALVRHGRTAWNRERRMQGQSDIALDPVGEAQAEAAGRLLATAVWTRIVSSPLRRASQSAEIIRRHMPHAEYRVHDGLVERHYGEADGLQVTEAWERWPDQNYPGAESVAATADRAASALRALLRDDVDTVVVAHGTLLRLGIEAVTGHPCSRLSNGDVVLLEGSEAVGYTARWLTE